MRTYIIERKAFLIEREVPVVISKTRDLRETGVDPRRARRIRKPGGQIGIDADGHDRRLAAAVHDAGIGDDRRNELSGQPWLRRRVTSRLLLVPDNLRREVGCPVE